MSGNTTDPGSKSSAEIEREVEATRANLTGTLEEIRDRASPGQLFEQALDYAKQSGGTDFARNLGASVRDNPLPLLLIGAGIGWLMLSDRRSGADGGADGRGRPVLPTPSGTSRPTSARVYPTGSRSDAADEDDGPSTVQQASETFSGAKSRAGETVSGLGGSISGAAESIGGAATSAYRAVADAAGSAAESVGSGAPSTAQRLADAGQGARDQFGRLGGGTRQGLGWLVREQPLVLGAIGLAVGAAVGALLPGTDTEDRLMGESRDDLAERARATAEKGLAQAKEVAGEHVERLKDRVGGADVSGGADRVGAAVGDAAREVREAVWGAARDVAEQAKSAVDPGAKPAG